ncbi:hypothetical protein DFH07DRAFT_772404 [Mycena maculata]|uniref:Uncharacterized protein n=1 Tax=Mycena maculata TaxID=230809 RepID=A0AAD7J963_9AGAR|nr:hypothetical protein DFH07DRAFT_772404 [Mycena maculata]
MLPYVVSSGNGISSLPLQKHPEKLQALPCGTRNMHKPVSRLSEQTGLQAEMPGLGLALHKPKPEKARLRRRKPRVHSGGGFEVSARDVLPPRLLDVLCLWLADVMNLDDRFLGWIDSSHPIIPSAAAGTPNSTFALQCSFRSKGIWCWRHLNSGSRSIDGAFPCAQRLKDAAHSRVLSASRMRRVPVFHGASQMPRRISYSLSRCLTPVATHFMATRPAGLVVKAIYRTNNVLDFVPSVNLIFSHTAHPIRLCFLSLGGGFAEAP